MGSIILDGVTVETECLVGAGALVSPGKTIPSGSLAVGVPAKVKRTLEADEIKDLKRNTKDYLRLAEAHRKTSHLL
jgi:carbonic anhydrase/acetyltransferase-like protein (isoleucine patch superfamily)